MMPPQMMKGIEPPSRKVAPGQGRGAHRSQPAGAPTTTPRGPAAVQLTSGLSLGEKAVQPVSISLVSTPPTSPPAPCGDTSERTLEPLDEPPYSPQSRGYASEKPRSPVHAVTFRTMVVVLALTGLLGSAIGGATTGVVTALESNFDLSTTQLGIVVVSYDVGAVLTAAPAGYFGMNHAPVWVGSGMLVAAACVVLFGVFSDLWLFILTQIGAGCGASVIWILGCVHIDNNVDNKAVVNAYTGWLMALAPLGIITGLMLVGFFLSDCSDASEGANDCAEVSTATGPPENCSGWRYPFVVLGCCLAPFGLWLLLSRKYYKSPKNATICSKIDYLEEDEWSRHEAEALSFGDFKKGMAHLACNGRYWLLIIGCAVHTFQSGAIIAFGPRFIEKQLCVERSNATLLTATLIPVVSIGVFLGGYIPRRFNWEVGSIRKTILFMGLTTLASSPFAVAAFMVDDVGPFLGFVMVSLGLMFSMSAPIITCTQRVVEPRYRGLAVACQTLTARVGGSVPGPLVLGYLLESDNVNPRHAYIILAACGTLLASLLWILAYFLQAREELDTTPPSSDYHEIPRAAVTTSAPSFNKPQVSLSPETKHPTAFVDRSCIV